MSRTQHSIVLGGRFRLIRKIGEGGMGVVWEAVELATQSSCAIKFVRPESDEQAGRRRFLREAEVLRGISHPNIVTTYEIGADDDGTPVIVMELLRGESLADRLGRKRYLSVGQTGAILSKVVLAVQAAHAANVVHRDLKPDNVFLCMSTATVTDVRVLDFGVAKKVDATPDKLTETGTLVGTPHYMSPEQAAGEKGLDARTDAWAISVIAFECLTGQMPVAGDNYGQLLARLIRREVTKLSELRPDLPGDLVAVIDAGLAPREQRSSLEELAAVFSAHADTTISPPPNTTFVPAPAFDGRANSSVTVAAPTLTTPPKVQRGVFHALAGFALVAVATCTAGLVVHLRHKSTTTTTTTITTTTTTTTTVESNPSSGVSLMSTSASVAASSITLPELAATTPPPPPTTTAAATTTTTTTAPTAPSTSARTTTALAIHPSGKPPIKTTPASSSNTNGRLQGGVGGDVPF